MSYLFPPDIPSLPVQGDSNPLAIRRIYCVGKNYADHASEMGGDPDREPPFFFSKPRDAAVHGSASMPFPVHTTNLHHEVELVVAIGASGAGVEVANALELVFGYGVGIDLTRRDLQSDARQAGRPWDVAKGFDNSAPVSAIHPVVQVGHPSSAGLMLTVNGEVRQQGNIADMIWNVAEIISELSTYFTLMPGDLIFTGTPAGVGKVMPGDVLKAELEGVDSFEIRIGERN